MNKLKRNESGFGAVETILAVVILCAIGAIGWYVHKSLTGTNNTYNSATKTSSNSSPKFSKIKTTKKPDAPANPYAGWKSYSNATYGISYRYPAVWTTSGDVISDATTLNSSATKQEFSTGLKLTTDTKYNNTVDVEVLNESLSTATSWYDSYYAQSSLNQVTKKSETLKGKQAVSYDVTNSGNDSKLYLFGVGNKTYTFGSINEEINVQNSSDYRANFQKVFDSLTLQ